ncbi:aldo/keto reductase [Pararcticibacter amylolyticus]|uniref:Alcohol dehydrogenase n=1 Tax=Pararcticibacter amylolyticus TaxID=2173175 RepID=A0A2U2PKS7_9SPHI|nr:aldo/keto reductase [Pararcticibacter amylolyticus]PWG82000.1 alcohol dehydrogenase [Pararcticibacter amylolyticus]
MERRKLGNSELEVSPLCFGGNVFGWTADQSTSFRLLDSFLDLGFDFIDTADVYSRWVPGNTGGESEAIIGKWLKQSGKRNKVVLATKVGSEMGPGQKGLSKEYITKAVEASLKRLQTDYIDLYQSHYDDVSVPVEETLEAYAKLISEGKIRVIGASNFSPERLKEALDASEKGLPRYESLQPEYNLVEREGYESKYEPIVNEYGIGVISYYSLASGFLSGKYRTEADLSKSPRGQGVRKYLEGKGKNVLATLDEIAAKHHATPAQVSLAWLIAHPGITAPIVSATTTGQLEDIAKSATLKLDESDLESLNRASAW